MSADARPTIVVSGLPRSGTSLVMQMLAAAGLPVFGDDARPPDADNPRGYFEHAAVRRLAEDPSVLAAAEGRVVKVVAPLVRALPEGGRYRVIFVERAIDEVVAMLWSAGLTVDGEARATSSRHGGRERLLRMARIRGPGIDARLEIWPIGWGSTGQRFAERLTVEVTGDIAGHAAGLAKIRRSVDGLGWPSAPPWRRDRRAAIPT